jgi:hypothetical protein
VYTWIQPSIRYGRGLRFRVRCTLTEIGEDRMGFALQLLATIPAVRH